IRGSRSGETRLARIMERSAGRWAPPRRARPAAVYCCEGKRSVAAGVPASTRSESQRIELPAARAQLIGADCTTWEALHRKCSTSLPEVHSGAPNWYHGRNLHFSQPRTRAARNDRDAQTGAFTDQD